MYKNYIKRLIDLTLSLVVLVILWPMLLLLTLFVAVKMHGSPIFRQERIGLREKKFILYKFRSMTNDKDPNGDQLPDDKRLTRFGKFLRRSSLDELPQLLNVIRGDMALIGPRPLLESYLPIYTPEERTRHNVRPGIVGLAGVNGRNAQTWGSKFHYDIYYVNHVSILLDIKIFIMAIITVLGMQGVNEVGQETASRFDGTN